MGTILGTIGAFAIGAVVASATVVGVVSSQTGTTGTSPASVSEPVIQYGSTK